MTLIKKFFAGFCIFLTACSGGPASHTLDDKTSLVKTTEAIRDGFAKGDVNAVLQLHHPTGWASLREMTQDAPAQ